MLMVEMVELVEMVGTMVVPTKGSWHAIQKSIMERENQRVKYAASSFVNKALTWWNTQVQARDREAAIGMSWTDFKALLVEELCPSHEMEKLESEFWNHKMTPYHTDLPTPSHQHPSIVNYGSSSHHEDNDEDDGASRASTPSPTSYLNSLEPLNYERYNIPTSSQQNEDLLFERQTELLNQTQQIHDEVRGGLKSFGKALQGFFGKKKK
ncbi:hypothetical protein Tco_0257181 [Tanacetum coccineum]